MRSVIIVLVTFVTMGILFNTCLSKFESDLNRLTTHKTEQTK